MGQRDETTGFQRDILCVLCGLDDPKGMEIQSELESYYGSEVLHARVYQNLDSLAERGLVEKGERDSRTNYYRITDAGRDAVQDVLAWKRTYTEDVHADTV
ncbi:PadR family transcriptional regulator [Halobacterium sp. KA-4]|jgi:PadR family transcriptional regulator PadR|uniref:PadR family transcriptional regulator n=1 Tax=Halobacterium sp. KA-4 TaxID=2896367 RepID=UPI001E2824FB|nr:archaellum operon transcriptional activator EarA family protein [Halobacterium sp. KA-4]MCD2199205.1 PadR family transcriptional regulator [Halobacterium sp. KA-4]